MQTHIHNHNSLPKSEIKEEIRDLEEDDGLIGKTRRKTSLDIRQSGDSFDMFECN